MNERTWDTKGVGSIETPFNIEAILSACPKLYAAWCRRPFYLTMNANSEVILRYFDIDAAERIPESK